jgi:hypothetical protein
MRVIVLAIAFVALVIIALFWIGQAKAGTVKLARPRKRLDGRNDAA